MILLKISIATNSQKVKFLAVHGTIVLLMETNNTQAAPAPPRIFTALKSGFDAVTNHIALILFPIGLDILIWFAPRLRLKNLIEAWLHVALEPIADMPELVDVMAGAEEIWALMAERFNLLITLRSYPVGVPSLMVSTLPMSFPGGEPSLLEINSVGSALLIAGLFTFLGLSVGSLYFSMVGKAALNGKIRPLRRLLEWPRVSGQIILLALVWLGLFMGVSIPVSCGISLIALTGVPIGPAAVLVFGTLMLWIIFPLLFSPHGIFVRNDNAWASIRKSIQITRLTLPNTATFFVSIMLVVQLFDMLWRIPPADSWLSLIGIVGHAFVSTGLLSASFIFYKQADEWAQSILEKSGRL